MTTPACHQRVAMSRRHHGDWRNASSPAINTSKPMRSQNRAAYRVLIRNETKSPPTLDACSTAPAIFAISSKTHPTYNTLNSPESCENEPPGTPVLEEAFLRRCAVRVARAGWKINGTKANPPADSA